MNRTGIILGASVIMLGIVSGGAEARKVYYEINGKKYSYSTRNRAETAEAQKRIAAAKKAEAAKAKAEEEKAKHPLVAVLGSTAQMEARDAQERLKQLLTERAEAIKAEQSSAPDRQADRRDRRQDDRKDNAKREVATASAPSPAVETPKTTIRPAPMPAPVLASVVTEPAPQPVPEQASLPHRTKVRTVSFDVETGIKTTIMVDGAIEEEPFDSSVLPHLASEQGQANSLMAFVKQLRKASPEETTGSITATALPAPQSVSPPR